MSSRRLQSFSKMDQVVRFLCLNCGAFFHIIRVPGWIVFNRYHVCFSVKFAETKLWEMLTHLMPVLLASNDIDLCPCLQCLPNRCQMSPNGPCNPVNFSCPVTTDGINL